MFHLRVRIFGFVVLIALFLAPTLALAQGLEPPIPSAPSNGSYVLDTLGWLNASQESEVNSTVAKLDSDNLAEIAVVTLDNCGDDKEKFRNDLFRSWGIGHKDRNDGLLIMICWYGGDKSHRSLEQEVGYGLESTIPDLLSSKVAKQYFVPAFASGASSSDVVSSGKAGDALVAMVKAYDGIIRGNTPKELTETQDNGGGSLLFWIVVIIVVILIILVIAAVLGDGGSGGGGYYSSSDSGSSSFGSSDSGSSSFGGGSSGGGGSSTGF